MKTKLEIYIEHYLINLPKRIIWDLYWLPTTFLDWVSGKTCRDCGSPLDIWGECEGLKKL